MKCLHRLFCSHVSASSGVELTSQRVRWPRSLYRYHLVVVPSRAGPSDFWPIPHRSGSTARARSIDSTACSCRRLPIRVGNEVGIEVVHAHEPNMDRNCDGLKKGGEDQLSCLATAGRVCGWSRIFIFIFIFLLFSKNICPNIYKLFKTIPLLSF
jgi:hypothetical protein